MRSELELEVGLARVKCSECVVIVAQLVILVGMSLEMRSLGALLSSFQA